MSEGCERYKGFVRTASGMTVTDPYGYVPTRDDYAEWLDVALRFIGLVDNNVDITQAKMGASEWPQVAIDLRERYDDLPSRYNPLVDSGDIQAAVTLGLDAACRLGELEDAMAVGGLTAQIPFDASNAPTPETPQDWGAVVQTGGNMLFLLAGLFILTRDK